MQTGTTRLNRGKFTNKYLDPFQFQGDPLADAVIETLGGRMHKNLLARTEAMARQGDGACRDFLEACNTLPKWVDFRAMEAGRRLGFKFAPHVGIALLAGSLVEGYALGRTAEVLVATGRLTQDVRRRLYETSDFAYQLGQPGALAPGGNGHRSIMKVRLLHAAVRRHLAQSPQWQPTFPGLPINQEDMAITLIEFGYEVRRGLGRLGVRMSEEEADSHHLLWRYAGHVLGVDPALLTKTRTQELALYTAVTSRQRRVTEDSKLLMRRSLEGMAGTPPFYLPSRVLFQISRHLLGNELADQLEIPRSLLSRPALRALVFSTRAVSRTEGALPVMGTVLYHLGHLYASRYIDTLLAGTAAEFSAHMHHSASPPRQ